MLCRLGKPYPIFYYKSSSVCVVVGKSDGKCEQSSEFVSLVLYTVGYSLSVNAGCNFSRPSTI